MTTPDKAAARDYIRANVTLDTAAMEQALRDALASGYAGGALAAAVQPAIVKALGAAEVYGPDPQAAWDAWQPGDVDASLILDHGFAELMDEAGITIRGIADTTLDRMGSLLAEGAASGASVDEIASSLYEMLGDPARAYSIANTELNRAITAASLDTYAANGIRQWNWVLSPGACPRCTEQAAANPHGIGEDAPPAHPNCRCAVSPVDPGSEEPGPDLG